MEKDIASHRVYLSVCELDIYIFLSGTKVPLPFQSTVDDGNADSSDVKANFYITFYFIAGALAAPEVDPFGHNIGKIIFILLRYACVLLICLQFILSMGNRPQG